MDGMDLSSYLRNDQEPARTMMMHQHVFTISSERRPRAREQSQQQQFFLVLGTIVYLLLLLWRMLSSLALLLGGFGAAAVVSSFPVGQQQQQLPMPFKWPVVGTLPDFMIRGGANNMREIYEVSTYITVI